MKIGFIGLGNMGNPMVRNLLKTGQEVVVYDVVPAAVESLAASGAKPAASIKSLAGEVELVITMLPSSPQVKAVYLSRDGVLAGIKPGVRAVDSSTIDPHTAREVAAAAAKQGNPVLDAPVSGGTAGAEKATLTFMVGGRKEDYEAVKPVLSWMGKNVVHCGPEGNGQVAKICNNLALAISMIGICEAMTLGAALNIDPKTLAGILNTSSARCWSSDTNNPYPGVLENVPSSRGYTGGFMADLMLKDLGLATDSARLSKHPVIMGAVAQQLYQMMSSKGLGQKDFSAIIKMYKDVG
ncbi:MAG TPA: 3-hydroxyisobutyrate dehydrogenase [Thermodesulfobacteriota bacterium]|nr:3-hydroxyisobutyrate dehydrogenase [Thermodesulfobacteriota bacterium]